MLYLLSAINLFKNILVKLWSVTLVRVAVIGAFTYYIVSRFGTTFMSRASNSDLSFQGFDSIFYFSDFGFNPEYIKSRKATFGIMNALSRLGSVYLPGLLAVGIILFVQKAINTYKAPPLPIIYRGEDADTVVALDYRIPILYTKGEVDYTENTSEEVIEKPRINLKEGATV